MYFNQEELEATAAVRAFLVSGRGRGTAAAGSSVALHSESEEPLRDHLEGTRSYFELF